MVGIPGPAKERLLRIMRLLEKNGDRPLTSAEAEAMTGWARETIRKDISYLEAEAAGTGAGYSPKLLIPAIRKALGLDRRRLFCIVGLGRLGSAYLNYSGDCGIAPGLPLWEEFELAAGFDSNVNRVEILKSSVPLYPAYKIPEVVSRLSIELALLCVPAEAAQASAEKLASAGIRGILNFAPVALKLPSVLPVALPAEIVVRNVSAVDELRALAVDLS
jgi:redox-sensing transcriptional repressor